MGHSVIKDIECNPTWKPVGATAFSSGHKLDIVVPGDEPALKAVGSTIYHAGAIMGGVINIWGLPPYRLMYSPLAGEVLASAMYSVHPEPGADDPVFVVRGADGLIPIGRGQKEALFAGRGVSYSGSTFSNLRDTAMIFAGAPRGREIAGAISVLASSMKKGDVVAGADYELKDRLVADDRTQHVGIQVLKEAKASYIASNPVSGISIDGAMCNDNFGYRVGISRAVDIPSEHKPDGNGLALPGGYARYLASGITVPKGEQMQKAIGNIVGSPIRPDDVYLWLGRGNAPCANAAGRAILYQEYPLSSSPAISIQVLEQGGFTGMPHEAALAMTSAVETARMEMMNLLLADEIVDTMHPMNIVLKDAADGAVGTAIGFEPARGWKGFQLLPFATDMLEIQGVDDILETSGRRSRSQVIADYGLEVEKEVPATIANRAAGIAMVMTK